jgi:RNA polymerase sigma-70 factor, ECF subfamily
VELDQLYSEYKPLLIAISYRMLGSLSEAEDVVQEVFLDIQRLNRDNVENMKAYLCKMVTNRSLDYLKSAQRKREVYTGPWLPEPLILEDENDPLQQLLQQDRITYALLTLMEQLNPVERAVFVLREAFEFKYEEISHLLEKEEANCRKILSRAKRKLQLKEELENGELNHTEEASQLIFQFVDAANSGKLDEMLRMLQEDAVLYTDGGGHVTAAIRPILTSGRIVQFIMGLLKQYSSDQSMTVQPKNINGQTGLLIESDQEPKSVVCFDIEDNRIKQIFIVRNPEKLVFI